MVFCLVWRGNKQYSCAFAFNCHWVVPLAISGTALLYLFREGQSFFYTLAVRKTKSKIV
jgi:hypothetical protein